MVQCTLVPNESGGFARFLCLSSDFANDRSRMPVCCADFPPLSLSLTAREPDDSGRFFEEVAGGRVGL